MTRRSKNIFQQRCNKTTTFPNYSLELERGLDVHLVVGIHVAYVVVVDQVHVTCKLWLNFLPRGKSKLPPRGATCVNLKNLIRSLPSSFLQLKTGVRMRLTSQIKELDAILQKLIKLWTWNNSWSKNETMRWIWLLAMRINLGLATSVVGSVQQRKRKQWFSQELEQSNKRKPF